MPIQLGSAYGKVVIDSSGVKTGVQEANRGLKGLESSVKTISKGIAQAFGLVTAEVVLLKKAFDFGQEGARVEQMGRSFDTMLNAMGAAPDLLRQLQDASMGTIDDMSLMASTSLMLAGTQGELGDALAKAAPELLEMANVAQKLNPSLGDTTFLYDSLARGIKRGSPLILDNLGILVKIEDANKKYAASMGLVVDELTAEQQKIALLNAVLEQKEILMKQAGGTADSATDTYERMKAAVKNAADSFMMFADKGLRPAAEGLFQVLTFTERVNQLLADARPKIIQNANSWDEYVQAMTDALVIAGRMSKSEQNLLMSSLKQQRVVDGLTSQYGVLTEAKIASLVQTGKIDDATALLVRSYQSEFVAQDTLIAKFDLLDEGMWFAMKQAEALGDYVDGPLRTGMSEAAEDTYALQRQQEEAAEAAERQREAEEKLTQALDDLQLFISGPIGKEYDSFVEKQKDLNGEAANLRGEIDLLNKQKWLTKAQKEEFDELTGKLEEVDQAIADNVAAHDRATKEIVFDLLTQRAAMDGLSQAELQLLNDIALRWGLVDQATHDAVENIDDALTGLANGESLTSVKAKIERIGIAAQTAQVDADKAFDDLAKGKGLTNTTANLERINALINGAAGVHDVTFRVNVTGDSIPMQTAPKKGEPAIAEATGVRDFWVPAGYPNDTFLAGLTSGERVTVETPGQAALNGARGGVNVTVGPIYATVDSEVDMWRLADVVADVAVEKILRANRG